MNSQAIHPAADRIILIVTVLLLSAVITYLQIARPTPESLKGLLGSASTTTQQTQQPTSKEAKPAAPPATPAKPTTAITMTYVNVRAAKSTTSPTITKLEAGTAVELAEGGDAKWQAVRLQGKTGYIFKEYLQF